jgi:O-acetyl-ADP-ribose deacetylase (regulator of RNase III)
MIPELLIKHLGTKSTFAGIGSSKLNGKECKELMLISLCMILSGHKCASGSAICADNAFEYGAKVGYDFIFKRDKLSITDYSTVFTGYLPWPGFNLRPSTNEFPLLNLKEAEKYTSTFHPAFNKLSKPVVLLMARNAMQILGETLNNKVGSVICSTKDGANRLNLISSKTGGTGQGLKIACANDVRIFNNQNPQDKLRLKNWVDGFCDRFTLTHGHDPRILLEDALKAFKPITQEVNGNLIKMLKNDEIDVIVHGCNIHNVKGAGLAEAIFKAFPEAEAADKLTPKGSKKKLGTVSVAKIIINGKTKFVINGYTQERWGRDENELYLNYPALRKVLSTLKKYKGLRIGLPRIGAGLALGDWPSIANMIDSASKGLDVKIVNFKN